MHNRTSIMLGTILRSSLPLLELASMAIQLPKICPSGVMPQAEPRLLVDF